MYKLINPLEEVDSEDLLERRQHDTATGRLYKHGEGKEKTDVNEHLTLTDVCTQEGIVTNYTRKYSRKT